MEAAELRTIDVVKRFGGIIALDRVNLIVPPKRIVMLIGPNGSGKTTLINVISGVYRPDRGKVYLNNIDITGLRPHKIYEMGVVRTFQIPALFSKLTVLENLLVASRDHEGERIRSVLFGGGWREREEREVEKAFGIMELLNLSHLWDRPAYELSGGQMKLLEVGKALMSDPQIVLMDEPVAGVNPKLAHEIMRHLMEIRDRLGISFLVVEHRLDIVLDYIDTVYAMHRGRIIASGNPSKVVENQLVIESYLGGG